MTSVPELISVLVVFPVNLLTAPPTFMLPPMPDPPVTLNVPDDESKLAVDPPSVALFT